MFPVTRGTRQGSIISPKLFNIFINDLLLNLDSVEQGVMIGDTKYNTCAYADDITVFSSSVTGLQSLIDVCDSYAEKWRFSFGISETKCMSSHGSLFVDSPSWKLDGGTILQEDFINILGVTYSRDNSFRTAFP